MDANNDTDFASKEALDYWQDIDLYLGGTEHATGHLLYSRFWNKVLKDLGYTQEEEFAKKLINQGMIQGVSALAKILVENSGQWNEHTQEWENENLVYSLVPNNYNNILDEISGTVSTHHIPIDYIEEINGNSYLSEESFEKLKKEYLKFEHVRFLKPNIENSEDYLDGKLKLQRVVEKMSKSKFNVVNPDTLVERYGADTLRLYEMFLGPLTESKPWDTRGIEGTYRFLRKFWRLFFDQNGNAIFKDEEPNKDELKSLHKTIKKVAEDVENFSFNTSVSSFMICVNELTDLKCHKKAILKDLLIILSPYAPHIAEELWEQIGKKESITKTEFPSFNATYLIEASFEYPIQINGKVRVNLNFPAEMAKEEIEKQVLANDQVIKWMEGKELKKIIVVPKRIVNVVV